MSETKFSQGPWRVDPEGINGWVVCGTKIEEPSEDPFWSARLGTFSLNRGHSEKLRSTAYLIAAAPDMYRTLKGLLAALSCTGNAEDPGVLIAESEAREIIERLDVLVGGEV